jgi:hypothetical protein
MKAVSTRDIKNLRTCKNGHRYYKSSGCPTCPMCEAGRKPLTGFLSVLSSPARRALESQNIKSLKKLSTYTENELLELHGFGKSSLPKLRDQLRSAGLEFSRRK